jgi:Spy/CpxP family protein refolding chaperone
MHIMARNIALALSLSGSMAALALAQPPGNSGTQAPVPPAKAPAQEPPLTPCGWPENVPALTTAQREQLAALQKQTRERLAAQREQLRSKHHELRALWLASAPSEPAIIKKMGEIDAIRVAMRPALVKSRLSRLALLTPEQRLALGQPRGQQERPCCAERAHAMHAHGAGAAPPDVMPPWLDDLDDGELEGEGP